MKSVVVFNFIVMFLCISHLPKAVDCSASNVNNCYTFHDVDSTWDEAREACRDMGAHLVTMETTDEWNKVKGFIADKVTETGSYTHYYIGLRKESGTWKWTEAGSPGITLATDDSRWQIGQPSSNPREVCGEIWYPDSGTQGHFNNIECNVKYQAQLQTLPRGYICENY
ncbi:snaclec A6-like [Montipora capricornis]|uniref:snaclec A6-like n=1 Tax=Montipora capricornis TaxID=246305 RepID=UPI0035F1A017